MQAAVVSVLLMAGACGNSGEPLPAPTPVMVTVSQPAQSAASFAARYPSAAGGVYEWVGPLGCPHYSPVWLLKDCAAYYPGNYAVPYDYRETFSYPWHGPRPPAPMIEVQEAAAKPPAKVAAKQSFRSAVAPRAGSRSTLTAK